MSVLGFSHIVTEVKDLNESLEFYRKLGYSEDFRFSQEVPSRKLDILDGKASQVDLLYLKHKEDARIGIELIKHDQQGLRDGQKTISYGWAQGEGLNIVTDPQHNKLAFIDKADLPCAQHIFIPTECFKESIEFYQSTFHLVEQAADYDFQNIYQGLYTDVGNTRILKFQNCLIPTWNVWLHIIETSQVGQKRSLNQYGFSCFCFLIDQEEYKQLKEQKLNIVGPFKGQKTVNDSTQEFEIGFIQDPNAYLVEIYMPSVSVSMV